MPEPTIPPALSPTEWEDRAYNDDDASGLCVDIQGDNILSLETHDPEPELGWRLRERIDPMRRHALAAFALYGQPFGFTQEDVTLLRKIAAGQTDLLVEEWERLPSLAVRIQALLPHPADVQ